MTTKAVPLSIVSYNRTDWQLTVMFQKSERYTYLYVPPNWYTKICSWLSHRNYSAAIKFLQRCAKEGGGRQEA